MKKIMKSALVMLLVLAMTVPCALFVSADYEPVAFTDVPADSWYAPYVYYCHKRHIVNGLANDRFDPQGDFNRAMFVTMLARAFEIYPEESSSPFTDIDDISYATNYIQWAYNEGIVNGVTPTTFEPRASITREQMCTILCRFADAMGLEMPAAEGGILFYDDGYISDYAYEAVYSCANAGIVNGVAEGVFAPRETATRAQACAIFKRFILYTTSTVTEEPCEDGKTEFIYSDRFYEYARGYRIVDDDGNVTEIYYEEDNGYWEKTENAYENGQLVRSAYTTSSGYADELRYEYYEDGSLLRATRVKNGVTASFTVDEYADGTDLIEQYTVISDESSRWVTQRFNDGKLSMVVFHGGENVNQSLRYNYDENGDVSKIYYNDTTNLISVLEGDFTSVNGMVLPTKMSLSGDDMADLIGGRGNSYDISFDYENLTVTVNNNYDYIPVTVHMNSDAGAALLLIAVMLTETGDMYEAVTLDNYMELLA